MNSLRPQGLTRWLALSLSLSLFCTGCGPRIDLKGMKQKAEKGDKQAQYELGVAYLNNKGVKVDSAEAAKWLGKAAQQGHSGAQFRYGMLVLAGDGVDQDLVQAYKWVCLAAKGGDTNALEELKVFDFKMSPIQIKQGEKLASSFTAATTAAGQ